ncbi:O-antigen ligase family protein [Clostridium sp. HBUAS56017]|uniref:O-antigen ligase family protein n=1 Tax=Clostridium sp. HBUAS56017 TaxID=2571128 RepID=UPI0011780635|nr:O-antigen ligase family protein [Clostridium sp. HBUAS56017]
MEFLLFFKPLADMLWQVKSLDMILAGFCLIIFTVSLYRIRHINLVDMAVCILFVLFTASAFRETEGLMIYAKISSSFMLYLLGRVYYLRVNKLSKYIAISYIIVLITNLICIAQGKGSIEWGHAITLNGMYYFKTDFAFAITQSVIFLIFINIELGKIIKAIKNIYCFIGAPILILLSNSRLYLLAYLTIVYIYSRYVIEQRKNKVWNFKMKNFVTMLGVVVVGIFLFSALSNTALFSKFNFISFNFTSIDDLFSGSNTQGRSQIWTIVLDYFNNQDMYHRLFGVDLVTDSFINPNRNNAHNMYLKTLFSTGYLGLFIFILFLIILIYKLNKIKDRRVFYLTFSMVITFLLSGISDSSMEFSQLTWISFFYFGSAVSIFHIEKKEDKDLSQ